jgi:hypothetical protein
VALPTGPATIVRRRAADRGHRQVFARTLPAGRAIRVSTGAPEQARGSSRLGSAPLGLSGPEHSAGGSRTVKASIGIGRANLSKNETVQ